MPRCKSLPDDVCQFLEHPWEVILSTINPSGLPQQTVMWFNWDGETILMTCSESRKKVRNLKLQPRASVLMYGPSCYVSISGEIEICKDLDKAQENLESLLERYDKLNMLEALTNDERVTLRLYPQQYHVYGVKRWLESKKV